MAGSSSNSCVVVDVEEPYPYPSHVCAPNFVTVKLSGRDNYGVWKTQMMCLLESHDMLGFINGQRNGVSGKEKERDYIYMLWRRSDSLVKGWILGSLSEQALRHVVNLLNTNVDFSAKDVWDKLHTIYGPPPLLQHSVNYIHKNADEKERRTLKRGNTMSEDEEKTEEERAKVHQSLYEATLTQNYDKVYYVLRRAEVAVEVTDQITINGNTALHVTIGTTKNTEFLKLMLAEMPEKTTLLDIRNADGSTLLHVAAIVGNTDAAKILVERNRDLLLSKDNEGYTPIARALSNMHTDTYLYLLKCTNTKIEIGTLFSGRSGDELLVNAISSKDFHSALVLRMHYHRLASDAVLMAIAQNFPRGLNRRERTVYKLISAPTEDGPLSYDVLKFFGYIVKMSLLYTCGLGAVFMFLLLATWGFFRFLRQIIRILLMYPFKFVADRAPVHQAATDLLESTCDLIKYSNDSSSHHYFYTNPVLEASRQNAYEVVVMIVSFFPNAIWSTNEDGHNIIQYAVINRSEKVYNLVYQMSEHKNVYKTIKDPFGNNLLHLAARLAPTSKLNPISGAALQIQRELQWFKEVEGFVCPLNIIQKNSFGETPQMVFTREHKELVVEGEKWMKATAESYTINAALITTIVFAAAIRRKQSGFPIFTNDTAFTIFAISDAISLFTSVTSLLMFLSILTTRFAEQDFLFKLPTKLIIGLTTLFISTMAMIVAFGATLFLVFGQRKSWILYPIAALTCLPITSFVTLQFPDLMSSTYGRSIFGKKRDDPFY